MKICTIYHNQDLDGWASAAIVKYYHEKYYPQRELELVGWNYGDPIPWTEIYEANKLYLVDVSFDKNAMAVLFEKFGTDFIWIDHHVSALKENDLELISGIQNSEKAACEHTWDWFFADKDVPEFVWYLGMYDSFRHRGTQYELDVLRYQYAARSMIGNPGEALYRLKEWDDDDLTPIMLNSGEIIYNYLIKEAEQIYAKSKPIEFDGFRFLAVNRERFNPINFGIDYHEDGYEGFACFWWDGKKWTWSLYNDDGKVDVSKIAKKRGGGGHAGAAGFQQNKLNPLNYKIK